MTSPDTIFDIAQRATKSERYFVVNSYFPSDLPEQTELFVDIMVDQATARKNVIAWSYPSFRIYKRQMFNGTWLTDWQKNIINNDLEPIDISSKIIANNNVTVKECSAMQVGKICFLSFTFAYAESTLHNKQVFSIDDTILPKTNFGGVASDYNSGSAYQFAVEKSTKSIRFTAVPANNLYAANMEVKGNIFWYI